MAPGRGGELAPDPRGGLPGAGVQDQAAEGGRRVGLCGWVGTVRPRARAGGHQWAGGVPRSPGLGLGGEHEQNGGPGGGGAADEGLAPGAGGVAAGRSSASALCCGRKERGGASCRQDPGEGAVQGGGGEEARRGQAQKMAQGPLPTFATARRVEEALFRRRRLGTVAQVADQNGGRGLVWDGGTRSKQERRREGEGSSK